MKRASKLKLPAAPPLMQTSAAEDPSAFSGPVAVAPLVKPGEERHHEPEEEFDEELAATRRRQAVAAKYTWAGHPLRPFSMSRKRWLLDVRTAAGAGPIFEDGSMFGDALRFLYLCLCSDEHVAALGFGIGLPGNAQQPVTLRLQAAIDAWADEVEDTIRDSAQEAANVFTSAWLDTIKTQAIPQANESSLADGPGNSHGPTKRRNTSLSSVGPAQP